MIRRRVVSIAVITAAIAIVLMAIPAFAQSGSPFGVAAPDGAGGVPATGLGATILAWQSGFYRSLSAAIRAAKTDGTAAFTLIGLSIAYGVLHAAGPGHGKAVISSYLLASRETLRKGIGLSFAAAAVQALVAIALVGLLAMLLGATAPDIDRAARQLELASYLCIIAVGAWLCWRKGATLWAVLARRFGWPGTALGHSHGPGCDHAIAPDPQRLAGQTGLGSAVGVVASIGIRPCTGAIIVLAFALAQGLFYLGIVAAFAMALGTAATVAIIATIAVGAKGLAVRLAAPGSVVAGALLAALEAAAALAVLLLGVSLFFGLLAQGPG
ncbi:MAG: nickel/cobalt transporter [Labrys sp. (in: a-proteobacteria)]